MGIWRLVLVLFVTILAGFVGGVWFVGTGLAFRWVDPMRLSSKTQDTQRIEYIPLRIPANGVQGGETIQPIGVPDPTLSSGTAKGLLRTFSRGDLFPTPGCTWEIPPAEFQVDREWHKSNRDRLLVGVPTVEPIGGLLRMVVTQTTRSQETVIPLRYVFFDAAGNRFPARVVPSGAIGSLGSYVEFTHHEWDELTPSNPRQIVYFGLERLVPDSVRLAAESARAVAKQNGIDLLPPPRLGEPFEFDLPTVDGQRVRSRDLKGKAVLVILCGPDRYRPFELGQIRKEFSNSDMAVVAISFDATLEQTEPLMKALGKPTHLVLIPNEPLPRRLWREGAEISRVPEYWIVDPAGILRFQEIGSNLSDHIAISLGRPTRQQKFDATVQERRERARAEFAAKQQAERILKEANPTPVPSPPVNIPDGGTN